MPAPRKTRLDGPSVIDVGDAKPRSKKYLAKRAEKLIVSEAEKRMKLVEPPPPLKEGEEDAWVDRRAKALGPHAMRELEEQLLYSEDPRDRRSAADKILDMTGHGKKEGNQLGSSPLVVIVGVEQGKLPWVGQPKTIEGVTDAEITKDSAGLIPGKPGGK